MCLTMNQQLDDLQKTTAASRSIITKELALSKPAREAECVFIPLDSTVKALKKIIEEKRGAPTFIRAPVAAGKTTLALYLADKYTSMNLSWWRWMIIAKRRACAKTFSKQSKKAVFKAHLTIRISRAS